MAPFTPSRSVRLAAAAVVCVSSLLAGAQKPRTKKAPEQTPWQMAEAARQQLLSMPAEQRTREDYTTVMDAYRLIYHGNPADLHAPEAIFNVGLLLSDEGSTLHDTKMLTASIGQFEFLRTQYPRSSLRIAALLEEAHVAANGLHDVKLARTKYTAFVEEYPQSSHIDEAQASLKSLRAGVLPPSVSYGDGAMSASAETSAQRTPLSQPLTAQAAQSNGVPSTAVPTEVRREASLAASQATPSQPVPVVTPASLRAAPRSAPVQAAAANVPAHTKSGLATVSAIRHWSTPTYTRVAIDLGDEVQYEAARVPNPDRIYFDLHGTHLAQELSGKAFNVTDDGFLKRIRAAQYSNAMTRVVLDVNDVTEYSAFLLPNPYRLIIDIHGGGTRTGTPAPAPMERGIAPTSTAPLTKRQQQTLNDSGVVGVSPVPQQAVVSQLPSMPPTGGSIAAVPSATAAPSTQATRTSTTREVAALSAQPDNERATVQPTTKPIAVVADARSIVPQSPTGKQRKRNEKIEAATPTLAPPPTAEGERTLQRALGLKISRIVIDPGHGGHDSGTLGAGGIMEKDVVLDVALRLGKLLHDKLGAEIIYTRSDDTFIPLETRTAIANKAEADLFLSIHANSSQDETARGVETYYLNFTSQPDALDVAARENAVSDTGVHQLADLVKKITLKDKLDESREFAADVDKSLFEGLRKGNDGLKDRGVKKAPFVVLIGANMPSILTEISFVTNGRDAAQLRTPEYRERVAESIYRGVAQYSSGMSNTRVAATGKSEVNRAEPHGD